MNTLNVWIHMIILAIVCSVGDALFKKASEHESPYLTWWFLVGSVIYGLCGFSWVVVLKTNKLAVAGLVFSVAWSLALIALGILMFRETLSPREIAGLALGLGAIYLLAT